MRTASSVPRSGMGRAVMQVRSTDFRGAIRRNVRNTWILTFAMILIGAVVGYAAGWSAQLGLEQNPALIAPPVEWSVSGLAEWIGRSDWGVRGLVAMLGFGALGSALALLIADRALLAMAGAKPANRAADAAFLNVVEEMAIASGLPVPKTYVIETDALNAFATGLRPSRSAVAVTRGLLRRLTREELQGVVGHEMAHILNGDVRYAVMLSAVVGLIALVSDLMREIANGVFRAGPSMRSSSSNNKKGGGAALILIALAVWLVVAILAPIMAMLVRMAISREREYLADATSARLTRNPTGLALALQKISGNPRLESAGTATEHMYIVNPMRAFGDGASALFSTHPPTNMRIQRLMDMRI